MKLYVITQKNNTNMLQAWTDWTDYTGGIEVISVRAFTKRKHALEYMKKHQYLGLCKVVAMSIN